MTKAVDASLCENTPQPALLHPQPRVSYPSARATLDHQDVYDDNDADAEAVSA